MNALPIAPVHSRPCLRLFFCGATDSNQHGFGSDAPSLGCPKLKRNTKVEASGEAGTYGDAGAGPEIIAAGGLHTLFVDEEGRVWTCGQNDEGALGRVTKGLPDPNDPSRVLEWEKAESVFGLVTTLADENFRAVRIAAGNSISAAVSDVGDIRVWGSFRGENGLLGISGKPEASLPARLALKPSTRANGIVRAVDVAAGKNHLLMLTEHGDVYACGVGDDGQLGRRIVKRRELHGTLPEKVVLGTRTRRAVLVRAGGNTSFAVDSTGDVWAWGINGEGQTGTGITSPARDRIVHMPSKVVGLSMNELGGAVVVDIAVGDHHAVFLTDAGQVYACGETIYGQVGLANGHPALPDEDADEKIVAVPTLVAFPDPADPVRQIATTTTGTMALTAGGALYAWGDQSVDELGLCDGQTQARTPKMIVRKDGGSWAAVAVACGGQHSVVLMRKKP